MTRPSSSHLLAIAGIGLLAASAGAQDLYCYDTEDGRRVCSDRYVPEDSRFDREIRNQQGVIIRTEQGEITEEEQAQIDAERRAREQAEREAEERRRYGQMLLDSYSSVESIESQRDRILEQIEGQITIIQLYLSNLENKLAGLEQRAQRFSPYSENADAPPLPENLSLDIERTKSSITLFRQRLDESIDNQEATTRDYEQHIETFRQLKGLESA